MEEIKEIWKSLDFMEYTDYEVSNWGNVKSLNYRRSRKERILKPNKNNDGYLLVGLSNNGKRKLFTIHQLVALAFIPNPFNLPCINHKDENPLNNHVSNLEWCTHKYNSNYGTRNERISEAMKGKGNKPIQQYTKEGIFIREWDSITQINQELNLSQGNICKCCKGKRNKCGGFIWRYKM